VLRSECNLKNWVRNLAGRGHATLKIMGPKTRKFGPDFGQLSDLTANNFGTEQYIVSWKSALKTTDTPDKGGFNIVYSGPPTKSY